MPQSLVLDASAAVKWFIKEDEHPEMRELRDLFLEGRLEIHIPSLLYTEFSNALRYIHGLTSIDVVRALNALKDLQLKTISDLDLLQEAVEIAFDKDITVYDALYIALARAVSSKLITYDTKLLNRFSDNAVKASQILKELRGDSL
ncbi:MAG: type II toxin-antitoxin system VapC family toxin [Candidatus Bathyarchaeia archaeon]|nr:type II toxin-antitoxin system VapC family toxin [Candidatus Bathyarchaeota archaeon]